MYATQEIEATCERNGWRFIYSRRFDGYDDSGKTLCKEEPIRGGLGIVMSGDFQRQLAKFRCIEGGPNATWQREGEQRAVSVMVMIDRLDI